MSNALMHLPQLDQLRVQKPLSRPLLPWHFRLFAKFAHDLETLKAVAARIENFLTEVMKINFNKSFQFFVQPKTGPAGAEVAALPFEQSFTTLQGRMEQALAEVTHHLIQHLNWLVSNNYLGTIQWFSPTTCRFSFAHATQADRWINERLIRQHSHMRYLHDVMHAKIHQLPAWFVRKPDRVHRLIAIIPPPLVSFCRIVTGREIVREAVEIRSHTEVLQERTQTYQYDPALTLGNFVLAGW